LDNNFHLTALLETCDVHASRLAMALRHLWVFGSRANLNARGGDIDLYVETTLSADEAVERERWFVAELYDKIGEQKIDVVLRLRSSDFHLPIYDVAREEGIQLV